MAKYIASHSPMIYIGHSFITLLKIHSSSSSSSSKVKIFSVFFSLVSVAYLEKGEGKKVFKCLLLATEKKNIIIIVDENELTIDYRHSSSGFLFFLDHLRAINEMVIFFIGQEWCEENGRFKPTMMIKEKMEIFLYLAFFWIIHTNPSWPWSKLGYFFISFFKNEMKIF